MKHMPLLRSRYSYQIHERITYSNNIRKDLRVKLKAYSIASKEPETKILDQMLEFFLNNKDNKEILTELVRNYY